MVSGSSTAYLVCSHKTNERFANCVDIGVQDLKLYYAVAEVVTASNKDKKIILVGRVVDSADPNIDTQQIAEDLVKADDVSGLISRSGGLAGRFMILYVNEVRLYVLPDAVASVPITFTTTGQMFIASNPRFIAEIMNWAESAVSKEIKSKAAQTHPLPYDLTMYDQVRKVLPNHYFDGRARRAVRFYPLSKESPLSVDEAVEISNRLLKNIVKAYFQRFRLSLPLTSGVDSRTILALCREYMEEIPTYTFFHDHFSERTADIALPTEMAQRFGFRHSVLRHSQIPNGILGACRAELGFNINPAELQNVWTYSNSDLKGFVRLDGNVSPLGKSSFGRDLPECFATPSYLVTKTHNFSKDNKKEVRRWIRDVHPYVHTSGLSKFDLFFWEHRVGNWTANSYLNSDLLTASLNIFNSRTIIETWLRVPRKQRMNNLIHKKIIELNWPELLEFPFNPDEKYGFLWKNSLPYYVAVWGKYTLESLKYRN